MLWFHGTTRSGWWGFVQKPHLDQECCRAWAMPLLEPAVRRGYRKKSGFCGRFRGTQCNDSSWRCLVPEPGSSICLGLQGGTCSSSLVIFQWKMQFCWNRHILQDCFSCQQQNNPANILF